MPPKGFCGYSQYVVSVTVTINVLPDKANKKHLSFIEIVTFHCFQRLHKKPPRYAFLILNVKKNPRAYVWNDLGPGNQKTHPMPWNSFASLLRD